MTHWEKRRRVLPKNHGLTGKKGYDVFIADRGAVRLEIPSGWVVVPGEHSISFYDRRPPRDRYRLEVSYLRLRPVDWSRLPVGEIVKEACRREGQVVTDDQIIRVPREDLDLAWAEYRVIDPVEQRLAEHRICVARTKYFVPPLSARERSVVATQPVLQALVTADYWPEDAGRFEPAWQEALRSLQLGTTAAGPCGPMRH